MAYVLWVLFLFPGLAVEDHKWHEVDGYVTQRECYEAKERVERTLEEVQVPIIVLKCERAKDRTAS